MATQNPVASLAAEQVKDNSLLKRPRIRESLIKTFLFLCGALSIFTTLGIVYILSTESIAFFTRQQWENTNKSLTAELDTESTQLVVSTAGAQIGVGDTIRLGDEVMTVTAVSGTVIDVLRGQQETAVTPHRAGIQLFRSNKVTLSEIFTNTKWIPQLGEFGIWPLVLATLMTSLIAMIVALPVGLAAAIYLSEYASERVRGIIKPILEILAGIPTVVFGYFALTFVTPLLRGIFGQETVEIFNTASAGIVVGILIIPLVNLLF
jgi:ABC-type phosphate transport system permease subunit